MIIKGKTVFVYDIEIFPNFFSCAVKNTESKNKQVYEISEWQNDIVKVIKLFKNPNIYFCGYNNLHYDDPIINALIINFDSLVSKPVWETNNFLRDLSNEIIETEGNNYASWSKYKYAYLFSSLDLLTMRFSSKLRVGLKEMQVSMEYPNVQEYDGDFTKSIKQSDRDSIKSYNINDIESTEELLYRSEKDIQLRLSVEEEFNISALNKDGVNLGMEIIKHKYLEETGKSWNEIKDLRSPCDHLCLKDIIFDYVEFKTPVLQKLLKDLKATCLNPNDNSFERKFYLGGVEHTFGMGGIHSVNEPSIFKATDGYRLIDDDVASLYPSLVIENNIYPHHLGPEFVKVYKKIKDDRIEAKRNGNKLKNETYKLAINGLTGNLQSEYSWVYDPVAVLRIRINGQLLLLMYAEALDLIGAEIIQSNTDGVFYKVHESKMDKINEIRSWWQTLTHLELEADEFEAFYQFAINDYLGVKKGWSETHDPKFIKTKGLFIDTPSLGKGLAPLIIPKALKEYFVNNIDPKETIYNSKNILDFCTYQKPKKEFQVFYGNEKVTRINRYYMSNKGKSLYKQRFINGELTGSKISLCANSGVTIYNKFDDKDISERDINYNYYLTEIYKIISPMKFKQLSLF